MKLFQSLTYNKQMINHWQVCFRRTLQLYYCRTDTMNLFRHYRRFNWFVIFVYRYIYTFCSCYCVWKVSLKCTLTTL